MIELQCALPDAVNEIEQRLVESVGSQKVTAAEVRRLLQEKLSSAERDSSGGDGQVFRALFMGRQVVVSSRDGLRKRRQAEFDAGRKIDLKIEELNVRIYGDTAVSTFYRIGTMKELDGITRQVHLRISGVWVRQRGEWKLAHRHESSF